jgi:hypothetical protein
MGKRLLGMCPICFSNLIDILLIGLLVLFIPIIAGVVVLYIILPISEALLNIAGWVLDLAIVVVSLVVVGILLAIVGLLIFRLINRNKKI